MVKIEEICKWIKKRDKGCEFVNLIPMNDMMIESRITAKGKYKVTLEFNAKEILVNPESLPTKMSDFIYRPFLMFFKFK